MDIGLTNEKSINQLVAHHSVIFKPEEKLMWVSSNPFQLGSYICYDLNKVFNMASHPEISDQITRDSLEIPCDPFLNKKGYIDFLYFKAFNEATRDGDFELVSERELRKYIDSNPEFYYTYVKAGDYYLAKGNYQKSLEYYKFAQQKEISSKVEREKIDDKILKLQDDTRN
jgi:hypothetical protein